MRIAKIQMYTPQSRQDVDRENMILVVISGGRVEIAKIQMYTPESRCDVDCESI